mmetsp:Transcript_23982/g.51305  ORF Transcript_23982/g.51305 Transcript_23982/m.51305 type:complete len:263 (+) Transcript_23982:183-971(+)
MTEAAIIADIKALVEEKKCGPILIRLSWHDAGVYSTGKLAGGCPNAAMRFTDAGEGTFGANAGLPTVAIPLLKPISDKYVPDKISHADLWTLAANVATESMGGPHVPTRYGRKDAASGADGVESQDGRLPGPEGVDHLRAIFHPKGFTDKDIAALSGAHTVGSCHGDRSGLVGSWCEDDRKFDNSYFKDLLGKSWEPVEGCPMGKHAASNTIMLNSDLALLEAPFKEYVELYAKDQDAFFKDYVSAWVKLQENGCEGLRDTL